MVLLFQLILKPQSIFHFIQMNKNLYILYVIESLLNLCIQNKEWFSSEYGFLVNDRDTPEYIVDVQE